MDLESSNFIASVQKFCLCPITYAPILEPVVTVDGHTYQREAITDWLKNSNISPMTKLPLDSRTLTPNHSFKNLAHKLHFELPVFIDKQKSLETQVDQLKEEIEFLKNELQHEKQRIEEHNEKEQKEFKTKKIEKDRNENKNQQINILRQQKNRLEKQIQSLRFIEQKQARQIKALREELNSFTDRYTKTFARERDYKDRYEKIDLNRRKILSKLQSSFANNFTFIAHLLNSIEEAKKYESEKRKSRPSSLQNIEQNGSRTQLSNGNRSKGIIDHLEQIIKQTVNKAERQDQLPNRLFGPFGRPSIIRMRPEGNQSRLILTQSNNGPNIFNQRPPQRNPSRNIFMQAQQQRLRNSSQSIFDNIDSNNPPRNIFQAYRNVNPSGSNSNSIFQRPLSRVHGNRSRMDNEEREERERFEEYYRPRPNIFAQNAISDPSRVSPRLDNQPTHPTSIIESRRHFWGNVMRRSSLREQEQAQSNPQPQQPSQAASNPAVQQPQAPSNPQMQAQQPAQVQAQPQDQQPSNQSLQIVPAQSVPQQSEQDSSLYKQLLTIKWMMSKRKYTEIPEFYNYRVRRNNYDSETYWFGVHVSVNESQIPFNEYFTHSWNHVRWLDVSACRIGDALWRQFIESASNFRSLMFIEAERNNIETVKKEDLQEFGGLVNFSIGRNKLKKESVDELKKYKEEHRHVEVTFDEVEEQLRPLDLP